MEMNDEVLLGLYPGYDSILGPYLRPDGREHIVLNNSLASRNEKGKTRTISYPKAIVESNIARKLKPNETIDHDDRDKSNHHGRNLVIRDRAEHAALDATRVKVEDVSCAECGTVFTPSSDQIVNRTNNHAGPFCSRRCTGTYGARIQRGGEAMERNPINKEYYKVEK